VAAHRSCRRCAFARPLKIHRRELTNGLGAALTPSSGRKPRSGFRQNHDALVSADWSSVKTDGYRGGTVTQAAPICVTGRVYMERSTVAVFYQAFRFLRQRRTAQPSAASRSGMDRRTPPLSIPNESCCVFPGRRFLQSSGVADDSCCKACRLSRQIITIPGSLIVTSRI